MKFSVLALLACFAVAVSALDFTVYVEGHAYAAYNAEGEIVPGLALNFNRSYQIYTSGGFDTNFAASIPLSIDVPLQNCANSTITIKVPVMLNTSKIDMSNYVEISTYYSFMAVSVGIFYVLFVMAVLITIRYRRAQRRIAELEHPKGNPPPYNQETIV